MKKLKKLLFENIHPRQIVLRNAFWLYLGEFTSKGLRVFIFLFMARFLGPQNLGIFEYFLSFIGLFFLFADFGVSSIFIRDYQQKENKEEMIENVFILKIFLSIISGFIALSGYFFTKKFDSFLIYLILIFFYVLQNIEGFFESYFLAVQKTEKRFIFNSFASVILFVLIAGGLLIKPSILIAGLAYLLSIISGLIYAYLLFNKEAKIKLKINIPLIKYYLSNGFPLTLVGILGYIFFSSDRIILAYLRPIEETGYYSLVVRIISVFFIIPSIFFSALFPYLSKKINENDFQGLRQIFKLSVISSILLGILFSLITFILAPIFIPLIFGYQFINSVLILQIFIWILILVYPTNFLSYLLISFNKQWFNFWASLMPAILNIVLNLLLIPNQGVLGAVYASLISQALNFILCFWASSHILNKSFSK